MAGVWRARPVALIRCLALVRRRCLREASVLARVIDLHAGAVFVAGHERVAGEEVGVGAVGAHSEQSRVEGAGASGDQLQTSAWRFAFDRLVFPVDFVFEAAGLPLVDVLLAVEVAVDEAFGGVEEDAAVFGEAESVAGERRFAGRRLARRVAGGAGEPARWAS